MNNNNINITEEDVKRIRLAIIILFIFGMPFIFPIIISSLVLGIISFPLITTKLFAYPFTFFAFLVLVLLLIINMFKRKENRIKVRYVLGFFLVCLCFSIFQTTSIKIDKTSILKEKVDIFEKKLYMDPYKKLFDDEIEENDIKFILNNEMNEYEFNVHFEVPSDLNFKEYYDIGFNDELELDFIEIKEYDIKLLLKYYFNLLIQGLKEGKIYVKNFETVTRNVTIEGNEETIKLIKDKINIENY